MSTRERHLYEFGPYRLDTAEQRLLRDGIPVPLTPKAFEMLVALVERSGHLVEKDELMKAVWSDTFVEESNLTNNVYELRKILGQGENGRSYIETVPKRGYRFAAPVRELSSDALVVDRRTLTRIVTEQREEEPPRRARNVHGARRVSPALLALAVIVIAAVAAYGGYKLIAQPTPVERTTFGVPFETMDISRLTTSGKITHVAISADGKYVANVVKDASGNSLWVKHLDAPSNVRIAGPAVTEYISVAFAPSLNSVYYIALDYDKGESTLYRVPVLGGPSVVVADDIYPIGFSSDGRQIAFVRLHGSESMLVVADADGSNQRVVATRQKPDRFELEWNAPAWSPDGKTIAFPVSLNDQRGHYQTIIGISVTDGTQTPLTVRRWSYAGQAVWLPDGSGLLVSAGDESDSPMQVWHVRLKGGVATQITHDLNDYRDLSLTRDASRLAAVQIQAVSNIWVAPRADARHAREIRSEVGSLETLGWTHDGQLVYRSSSGGKGADIWIVKADGTEAKQITVGARVAQGLAVTPDGDHIVFSSEATGRFHLWLVDTDGGNLRQLTDGNGEYYPQCTADGRWVVYQSGLNIDPRLWKIPIEGGQPVQLTTTRAAKPAVSPDGRMIAYSYLDIDLKPSRWGIGMISSDGGHRLKRFDFPPTVTNRYVRWSPDGQSIAFVNSAGGRSDIWLQPLDGRPPKQLTDFRSEQILAFDWSRDGRSLAFVRNVETSDAVRIQTK
jgi:Tol biopolymer transport system component/DNA-binding winged helix-turn-helix (wHTH) protein